MAFNREASRTPTAIADIAVELFSPDPTGTAEKRVTYNVQIRLNDGSVVVRTGDLIPHLTQAQINQLQSFMVMLRTKAEAEFLP